MLTGIVRFSVRRPGLVIGLACALLIYGVVVASRTRYDVFPEFAPPQVEIQTEARGLDPEQVEVLVTTPIEQAITGTSGVAVVRSQSIQGLSVIDVIFRDGTDIYQARQLVSERIGEVARRLPQAAEAPIITPVISSTGTALVVGLTSATRSLRDIRTFADWTLRPRLLAVPGVGSVTIFGGEVRQLQIHPDLARLRAAGLGLSDLVGAARGATAVRGAGVLDNANEQIAIDARGQLETTAELAASPVRAAGGAVLQIGDVARVAEGSAQTIGAGAVGDTDAVIVTVNAQLGANIREVAADADRAFASLRPAFQSDQITLHANVFRPAHFIDLALSNVTHSLLIGGVLVAGILLLFLFDARAAAVSLTAIPISLLTALVVLSAMGYSINTLTLGGLAVALGEVVDDAIIDVENIARRLRENRALAVPRAVAAVVIDASMEVRSSVVYATFVVVLVFAPVVTLTGVQGALFRPLGLAYACAILASLVVALTLTPALTAVLLARRPRPAASPVLLARLTRWYVALLDRIERHPGLVLGSTVCLVLAACLMLPYFGGGFLPDFNEGHLRLHMSAVPGTSLDESLRIGRMVNATLLQSPNVVSVAQRAGRAELGEDAFGSHYSEFEVELRPLTGPAARSVLGELRGRLASIPGVNFTVMPYLTERIEEVVSGNTAPVVVKLFGDDLDSLDAAAAKVAASMRSIAGATDVNPATPAISPRVMVRLRPDALTAAGVPAEDALAALETATEGTVVAQIYDGNRSTDVVVVMDSARRTRPEDLAAIPLTGSASAGARVVTLSQVADIVRTEGRYSVAHEGARRLQTVTADVTGRDVTSYTTELEVRMAALRFPRGVYADVGGAAAAQAATRRELLFRGVLAGIGIVLLLSLAFGDVRSLILIMANVPFALVGGVVAVFLTGGVLSIGSLVGFVTLFGISTRNAVMLISHYEHLVSVEGQSWNQDTARRGAQERLGPILMTAIVTGIALLPLALGSGDPGREIEGPLAVVILGGLATSTLLSLFVLPTLALRFGRFDAAHVRRPAHGGAL
jgi:CzcA family heavy metal efflux pump